MKKVTNDIYEIIGDGSIVKLSVTIGYRQDADIWVHLDDQELHHGTGSVSLSLGADTGINFKDLKVVAHAQDIQKDFDLVTMTVSITGGKSPKSWTVGSDSKDGHVYYLKVGITFIN